VANPPRALTADLDSLPFPTRHLLNPRRYWDISFFGEPTAWVLPSRGCPYDCIFCSQFARNTKNVRFRSAGNIADEIQEVVRNQRVRNFIFFDETFNINDAHVRSICNEFMRRKMGIRWWCAARADLVKEETARLMKKAGCLEMRIGLESANDHILDYLKKGITVAQIRRGLDILKRVGMNYSLQCIFGSPMESEETINNTLSFVKEYKPIFASFNVLTPLPGSQLFDEIKDTLTLRTVKSFDIVHTQYQLGRYSPAELARIIKKAYSSYYFSMGYLARLTREVFKRPSIIPHLICTGMKQSLYIYKSMLTHAVSNGK